MPLAQAITIAASIAAVLALLYVAVFGSRSLNEWWSERRRGTAQSHPDRSPSILHNIPQSACPHFVNRQAELAKLLELLSQQSRHFLVSIEGFAGVGKTALAQAAATAVSTHDPKSPGRFSAVIW